MATDVGLGDVEVPVLEVQPGDGTTFATLTATAPDGTETSLTVVTGTPVDGVVTLTGEAVTYDQAGWWVLTWTVTGTGASAETQRVFVVPSPVAGGPTWTPGRTQVAAHVPGRTLARDVETHQLTFDSTTLPPGVVVDKLIADAVTWVRLKVPSPAESKHDAATLAASLRAACSVELGYPAQQQEQSLARAKELCAQATAARDDLARANEAETGTDPTDPGAALLPLWSMPEPVSWGDEIFL